MSRLDDFIKDRDRILKNIESLSLEDIKKHCIKWNLPMPKDLFSKEEYVKGSLHKGRLNVTRLHDTSDEELKKLQEKSKKALDKLGWDYEVR